MTAKKKVKKQSIKNNNKKKIKKPTIKKLSKSDSKKLNKSDKIVLKHNIEAILFAAGKALELKFIADLCNTTEYQTKSQLHELEKDYKDNSVLMIINQDTSWKMTVREQYLEVVRKIVADTELSKTVLETLSMIAYRNPALQSEVVKARGVVTYDHVAELVRLGFVIKERIGRSYVLKLSEKFYEYFEIDGKKIKEVFQPVKERIDDQMLLGNLKIVNANADNSEEKKIFENKTEEERLGELEVFRTQNEQHAREINNLKDAHKGFLDSIDSEIESISQRTTEDSQLLEEVKSSDVQNRINDLKLNNAKFENLNNLEESEETSEITNENQTTENEFVESEEIDKDKDAKNEDNKLSSDELLSETEKAIENLKKQD